MTQADWTEPRGPHLPDTVTRVPLGVWPFLALAVLAAYGEWVAIRSIAFDDPLDVVGTLASIVVGIVPPLLGAALLYRHPAAHRTLPAITLGVALFALTTVAAALRGPVSDGIGATEVEFETAMLAVSGYSLIEALLRVFAITYVANGLTDARRFEDRAGLRRPAALLLVAALGTSAVTAVFGWASAADGQELLLVLSATAYTLTNLAWAYFGWTAYRGWTSGEEPRLGWGLAALAGVGYLVGVVAFTLLNVLVWTLSPTGAQLPFVFEVAWLLSVAFAGLWVALLAAFWVGLPRTEPAEAATPDPEAAMPPDSGGS